MDLTSKIIAGVAAAASLYAAGAQASTFVNGGFEASLTGWTLSPGSIVTPSIYNHFGVGDVVTAYAPVGGVSFAQVFAGDTVTPTTLSQTFVTSGGVFSGWAAFSAKDELPYNDSAFVRIFNDTTSYTLFSKDVAGVGGLGTTGWLSFQKTLTAGTWTIEAGALNGLDPSEPSSLLLDNFAMAEVPEPATWAMMVLGFAGLGAALRRRRALAA